MERDFNQIAKDYAKSASAVSNKNKFGKWTKLACRRFLDDLKRSKGADRPFLYSEKEAKKACEFIEGMPHVEGRWRTDNITLEPFQIFFLCNLFGFRRTDGCRRFTSALLALSRKNAKALSLETPIPTPRGWKRMGNVKVGDRVIGSDGLPCKVISTSQVYTDHECYEVFFSNGDRIVADAGHLWITHSNKENSTEQRTTEDIFKTVRHGKRKDVNHSILMPEPMDLPERELPIKPYTFGAWLGDGHSLSARITFDPADKEIIEGIRSDGYPMRQKYNNGSKAWTFSISDGDRTQKARDRSLASVLRNNCLIENKHIPAVYLRASKAQRLDLLQGLMDTDGTINKNGRVISFTSISIDLARGVGELLSTFGIKFTIRKDPMVCNGVKLDGYSYKVQFMSFRDDVPCFRIARKLDRMRVRTDCNIKPRSKTLQIVDVKKIDPVPVMCISVDNKDKMYLAGSTMIPTHNSTLAGAIGLYCLTMEDESGPQVISAATTGDQAAIVFNAAKRMAEKTTDFREYFNIEPFTRSIACYSNGGMFRPINARASTQDGLNPSCIILDEIHAHKEHDLLNVLQSASGARKNPMFLYTTTEGYETPGPWPELRKFSQQVLDGVVEADHFFCVIYAIDDGDDEFDEKVWEKANPLIRANPLLMDAIRKDAIDAKSMPGRHGEYLIKRMNRQAATSQGWIDLQKWKACGGNIDLESLKDEPCYGALDLASTRDLCSFRLVWDIKKTLVTIGWRWVPTATVALRAQRNLVPYAGWVRAGHIIETPGDVTDYDVVMKKVMEVSQEFNLVKVGYDAWNAAQVAQKLTNEGIEMEMFIQGPKSYHPAMKYFEEAYCDKRFLHNSDPVLTWCASNLVPRTDQNMNMAPDKKRSADKIDDMTALLMAIGIMVRSEDLEDIDAFLSDPLVLR